MPALSPVNAIVTDVSTAGENALVTLQAAKSKMTLELAKDSGWLRVLTVGAAVVYRVEVTQLGEPAPDQFTTTKSFTPPPEEKPVELPIEQEPPANAVATEGMKVESLASVKEALGIPEWGEPEEKATGSLFKR